MDLFRSLAVVLGIVGAALAVPAIASAETFCVNAAAACPAGGHAVGDLDAALVQAGDQSSADEILLGDKQTPYFGPFVYDPSVLSRFNTVTIRGVGGRPSLTGPSGNAILTMAGGALEHLAFVADVGEGSVATLAGTDVTDAKVAGPAQFSPDMFGLDVTGPSQIEDLEITGGLQTGLSVRGGLAGQEVTARRVSIHSGVGIGVEAGAFSSLTMTDSRVDARTFAVSSTGFVHAERSVLTTSLPDSVGLMQLNPSLGPFELDHVTIAHVGAPSGSDAAFELRPETPLDTRLHAVAIEGYTRGFRREPANQNPENVVISDSAWDASNDELGGQGAGVFVESGNSHVAPDVVNLSGGELHPRAGSSAIDRDAITDLAQFTDLDGVSALDGDGDGIVRPDAGAFEFRPPATTPQGGGGGGAGNGIPSTDVTAPVLKKLRLVRRPKLRLAFTASEAATVRIVPQRIVRGRAAKARRPIVRRVGAGRGSVALAKALRRAGLLRRGTVRLAVVATDAAGNRSPKRVLVFRLS